MQFIGNFVHMADCSEWRAEPTRRGNQEGWEVQVYSGQTGEIYARSVVLYPTEAAALAACPAERRAMMTSNQAAPRRAMGR